MVETFGGHIGSTIFGSHLELLVTPNNHSVSGKNWEIEVWGIVLGVILMAGGG